MTCEDSIHPGDDAGIDFGVQGTGTINLMENIE
jgi:hypothetical protein